MYQNFVQDHEVLNLCDYQLEFQVNLNLDNAFISFPMNKDSE